MTTLMVASGRGIKANVVAARIISNAATSPARSMGKLNFSKDKFLAILVLLVEYEASCTSTVVNDSKNSYSDKQLYKS